MHAGDNNTNYFHRFASTHRSNNAIWEITSSQGEMVSSDKGLKELAVGHFFGIYSKPANPDLLGQLNVIKRFPRFFGVKDCEKIGGRVSLEEVKLQLVNFARDKSPRLDRWTVEFYLHFLTFWIRRCWKLLMKHGGQELFQEY